MKLNRIIGDRILGLDVKDVVLWLSEENIAKKKNCSIDTQMC